MTEKTKTRRHQWTRMSFQRVEPLVVDKADPDQDILLGMGEEEERVGCMACHLGFDRDQIDGICPGSIE